MQLTVEQCQRAMSALDKIWESLPRSERSERKEEKEYIRDVLAASQAAARAPRLRQADSPDANRQVPTSEPAERVQSEAVGESEDEEDASPFEMIAGILMDCDPEDEREEVWAQAEDFMRATRHTDEARAEVLYMLSVFHCVECGAEKSRDPNEPHVCESETCDHGNSLKIECEECEALARSVDGEPGGTNPIRTTPETAE